MPSIDIKILNGLPVTVAFSVLPAEPEVGYMTHYIEEWDITHVNGRKPSNLHWLINRIDDKEAARIVELCYDSIS